MPKDKKKPDRPDRAAEMPFEIPSPGEALADLFGLELGEVYDGPKPPKVKAPKVDDDSDDDEESDDEAADEKAPAKAAPVPNVTINHFFKNGIAQRKPKPKPKPDDESDGSDDDADSEEGSG